MCLNHFILNYESLTKLLLGAKLFWCELSLYGAETRFIGDGVVSRPFWPLTFFI